MDNRELKIYTDLGNGANNPSFKGLSITEYTFKAPRMGSPELTATLRYETALDDEWTHKEYVTVRGEKYYIFNTPESSKESTSGLYIHQLSFISERDVMLSNVLFYDTVEGYSSSVDKPYSNNTKVTFYGTLREFVDRINCAFLYAGVADSCLLSDTSPSKADVVGDGYVAVIGDGSGDVDETQELSFEDKYIWEALTEVYNKFKVPFKLDGKIIEWNPVDDVVDHVFEYGYDKSLMTVSHTNANERIVNRITMLGSTENIPYYYPNETEYGNIKLVFNPDNVMLTDATKIKIIKPELLVRCVRVEDTIEGINKNGALAWKVGDKIYDDITSLGLEIQMDQFGSYVDEVNFIGEKIQWSVLKRIPFQDHLMPPKYYETLGEERFYNALNNTYKIPDSTEYYHFNNPYVQGFPREFIHEEQDIKPTIEGVRNDVIQSDGKGQLFGEIAEIAYDTNDNDNLVEASDSGDATKYQHPYFYIKLNKFSGEYGFNLFQSASQADPMTIQITSGSCNGCKFKVVCVENTNADGYKTFQNPVQVKSNGIDIVEGDWKAKISGTNIIESQQNTETNSIWIAVQKDVETFGDIMPSAANNYKPKVGDTFNIINIELPVGYIRYAEKRLEEAGIKYMSEHNDEKFTFSIKLSSIFIKENEIIADKITEYAKIKVKYNGKIYEQFISSYSLQYNNTALPQITIDLTDKLSTGSTFTQDVARQAIALLPPTTGYMRSVDAERRFISKVRDDKTPFALTVGGKLTTEGNFGSKNYAEGLVGEGYLIDQKGNIYADSLTLRKFLEVPELRYNRTEVINGTVWHAPGGGIVKQTFGGLDAFSLKLEEGEVPSLAEGDLCMGIWHFGDTSDATADSDERNGNIKFSGFTTVYFEIRRVYQHEKTGEWMVLYTERGGQWTAKPQPGMHFVAYGNRTDTTRQRSRYATRSYEYYLSNVKDWTFGVNNIMMAFGDLSGLTISGTDMSGYSAYLNNVYFSGVIQKLQTAPLIITLDSQGVNYLGDGEKCDIICRATRGVDTIDASDIKWVVTTDTHVTNLDVNSSGILSVDYSVLKGQKQVTITVEGKFPVNGVEYSDTRSIIIKDKALLEGKDGVTIQSSEVRYQSSTSGTVAPTGTWLVDPPSVAPGRFLWTRTVTSYSDGTSTTAYSVSRQGTNGAAGADGTSVTIASTSIMYCKTTTPTQPSDDQFTLTSIGTLAAGQYLWIKTEVTYSDGVTTKSYSVSYIGTDGTDGQPGAPGADGTPSYVHFAYCRTLVGTLDKPTLVKEFSLTPFVGARFIGIYSDDKIADSTDFMDYQWSEYKGADGADGQDGENAIAYEWLPNTLYIQEGEVNVFNPANYKAELRKIDGTQMTNIGTPDGYICWCTVKKPDGSIFFESMYTPNTPLSSVMGNGMTSISNISEILFELWTSDKQTLVTISSIKVVPRGQIGSQGPSGAVMRIRGEWDSETTYYTQTTLVDGTRYIDIVYITATNGARTYWRCKYTGSGHKPTATSTVYWEQMSDLGSMYADMIFAPYARINFLSGQEFIISDDRGNISGRIGAGAVPIYMGGENSDAATFALGSLGMARFGSINGKRIMLNAPGKTIEIYDDNNKLCTRISGDAMSRDMLLGSGSSTWSADDTDMKTLTNVSGPASLSQNVGTLTVTSDGSFSISTAVNIQVQESKYIQPSSSQDPVLLARASGALALRVTDKNNETVLYKPFSAESKNPGSGDNTLSSAINEKIAVSKSASPYKVTIEMAVTGNLSDGVSASVSHTAVTVSTVASSVYKAELFASGLCYSNATNDYFLAYNEGGNGGIAVEMENKGGWGFKCNSDGILMKHHGGAFMPMPMFIFSAELKNTGTTYAIADHRTFNETIIHASKVGKGVVNITLPGFAQYGFSEQLFWNINVRSINQPIYHSARVSVSSKDILVQVKMFGNNGALDTDVFVSAYVQMDNL